MNRFTGIGNITRDLELRKTNSGMSICTFTLAIDRPKAKDGSRMSDYLNCITFGKTAEVCDRYLSKGSKVGVEGRVQSRSYDAKDGTKRYVTEILVDRIDFLSERQNGKPAEQPAAGEEFSEYDGDDLPWL